MAACGRLLVEKGGRSVEDRIALWVYLAVKRRGLCARLIWAGCRLQRWAEVPPKALIRLINRGLLPDLHNLGCAVWSAKMFDEQLRRDGL